MSAEQNTRQIRPFTRPELYRLYRDVGDDSPWYDKALWQAITTLEDIADGVTRVRAAKNKRPQPTING